MEERGAVGQGRLGQFLVSGQCFWVLEADIGRIRDRQAFLFRD